MTNHKKHYEILGLIGHNLFLQKNLEELSVLTNKIFVESSSAADYSRDAEDYARDAADYARDARDNSFAYNCNYCPKLFY